MRVVAHCTGCVLLQGSHASIWAAAQPSLAQTRFSFQQVCLSPQHGMSPHIGTFGFAGLQS
jgi:hypothetical protein